MPSNEVLLAVVGVAGAAVAIVKIVVEGVNWAFRYLVSQLREERSFHDAQTTKLLEQCASERAEFMNTMKHWQEEFHAHTLTSREITAGIKVLLERKP